MFVIWPIKSMKSVQFINFIFQIIKVIINYLILMNLFSLNKYFYINFKIIIN